MKRRTRRLVDFDPKREAPPDATELERRQDQSGKRNRDVPVVDETCRRTRRREACERPGRNRFLRVALLGCLAMLPLLGACGEKGAEARKEMREAADATGDWVKERWDAWNRDLSGFDETLTTWREETGRKLSDASVTVKEKWGKAIANLDEQRRKLAQELEEARLKGKDAWDAAQDDLQASWRNLKRAFEDAKNEFK